MLGIQLQSLQRNTRLLAFDQGICDLSDQLQQHPQIVDMRLMLGKTNHALHMKLQLSPQRRPAVLHWQYGGKSQLVDLIHLLGLELICLLNFAEQLTPRFPLFFF